MAEVDAAGQATLAAWTVLLVRSSRSLLLATLCRKLTRTFAQVTHSLVEATAATAHRAAHRAVAL